MANQFEAVFGRFIESIGGQVLPRSADESADFAFRADNVVIELKTLERDVRADHADKLGKLVNEWARRGLVRIYGRATIDLQKLPLECQREWLDILEGPIEGIVRKANRQIRSTKARERLPSAKGLLLIVNDGNLLHTAPAEYVNLVARVLKKKGPGGGVKFPDIRGIVYFSYRVVAAGDSRLFWAPGTIDPTADADLQAFQFRLGNEWFAYYSKLLRGT